MTVFTNKKGKLEIVLDNLSQYDIVLASASPRRQELLTQLDIPFRVMTLDGIDETYPDGLTPEGIARYISSHKAEAYRSNMTPQMLIITADTIVSINGEVLGKPRDEDDAVRMLHKLSGMTHQVVTGVTVATLQRKKTIDVTTHVTFSTLTEEEITHYVKTFHPLDKAGAYGIQEWIGMAAVENISGSYWNVMGLPVRQLYRLLKTF